jgi:hypothetical protein
LMWIAPCELLVVCRNGKVAQAASHTSNTPATCQHAGNSGSGLSEKRHVQPAAEHCALSCCLLCCCTVKAGAARSTVSSVWICMQAHATDAASQAQRLQQEQEPCLAQSSRTAVGPHVLCCAVCWCCSCADESIDEIAAFLGVGDEVAALTAQ